MGEVYVAVTVSDGGVYHLALQTGLRAPSQPRGSGWSFDEKQGLWTNAIADAYVEYFIALNERQWAHRKATRFATAEQLSVTVVGWRRLSQTEHEQFNQDRPYRNALVDRGDRIEHDVVKARECCRNIVRYQRAQVMPVLDGEYMRALGQGDRAEQGIIETKRQAWRDAPANPLIDAVQSVAELKAILPPS